MSEEATAHAAASAGQFHNGLLALMQIQERDVKIRRLNAEMEQKPLEAEALKTALAGHRKRFDAMKESIKRQAADRNALEVDLESRIQTIHKYEAQSALVKTNEEYRALIKEIEELKKGNVPVEEKILDAMEKQEEEKKLLMREELSLKEEEGKLIAREQAIAQETAGIREHLEGVRKEREGFLAGVKPELLERYDLTFQNKQDYAIVTIEHGACGGCHMAITPQVMNEVKRAHELVLCENCARILVLPINIK